MVTQNSAYPQRATYVQPHPQPQPQPQPQRTTYVQLQPQPQPQPQPQSIVIKKDQGKGISLLNDLSLPIEVPNRLEKKTPQFDDFRYLNFQLLENEKIINLKPFEVEFSYVDSKKTESGFISVSNRRIVYYSSNHVNDAYFEYKEGIHLDREEKKSFLKKKKYEFFLKLGSLNTVFLHFTVSKKDDAFELSKCFDSGYKQYEKDKTTILKANNVRLASSAVKDDLEKLEKYRRMARTIEEKSQNVVELKHYLDNFVYRKSMKFMA